MMPPSYYRELRAERRRLGICQKCGKRDRLRPYTCCMACRERQMAQDARRAEKRVNL